MKNLIYIPPKFRLFSVVSESCIANGSHISLNIDPNSNSFEIENWESGDGFFNEEYPVE